MRREKSHEKQIERWVKFIKKNGDWRKFHKQFIDSQIELALKARKKLARFKGEKTSNNYQLI